MNPGVESVPLRARKWALPPSPAGVMRSRRDSSWLPGTVMTSAAAARGAGRPTKWSSSRRTTRICSVMPRSLGNRPLWDVMPSIRSPTSGTTSLSTRPPNSVRMRCSTAATPAANCSMIASVPPPSGLPTWRSASGQHKIRSLSVRPASGLG